MRKVVILLCLAIFSGPVFAAQRVSVEELEKVLTTARGQSDADLEQRLIGLELTERANPARFAHWQSELPGSRAQQALIALIDASAFLKPPAAEIPSTPIPDAPEQRLIVARADSCVANAIPHLPNFFATRDILRFEDRPRGSDSNSHLSIEPHPLQVVGNSKDTVFYRDGKEVVDAGEAKGSKSPAKLPGQENGGLTTKGVFGPVLAVILRDTARQGFIWEHWEQGDIKPLAVFRYAVPQKQSHYELSWCCLMQRSVDRLVRTVLHQFVGYHGEIVVDPDDGSILRLTLQADLKPDDALTLADLEIEYGPVEIGGKSYICPLKSISITRSPAWIPTQTGWHQADMTAVPKKTALNDVLFERYHLFRAETRILDAESALPGNKAPLDDSSTIPAVPSRTEQAINTTSVTASLAAAAPLAPSPASVQRAETSEIVVANDDNQPDAIAAPSAAPIQSGLVLHATSRLVDVDVVVYDHKGKPVTDLKQEDFEVYDEGVRQKVLFFTPAGSLVNDSSSTTRMDESASLSHAATDNSLSSAAPVFSNRPAESAKTTILLIDSSHLAFSDWTNARTHLLHFLQALPQGERVALYVMKISSFQVLLEATTDHALLISTITHWMPKAQDLAQAQDEEERNRQHFDWIHGTATQTDVSGNIINAPETAFSHDQQQQDFGNNPSGLSLTLLVGVARHLASTPGHKNLVWVTSDNVLADWTDETISINKRGRNIEIFALRAQEAMNEAHVSLYPLDASQLEAGGINADLGNVKPESWTAPMGSGSHAADTSPTNSARATAQMQQDLHPIQGAIREVAEATGGRTLRRAGNLGAELNGILTDGHAVYLLGFRPSASADGKYHRITIKLPMRRNLQLRYRTGYQYDKEPETLKSRFRQAVWRSTDANEIALSAVPVGASKGWTLKLRVAATDLDLRALGDKWADTLDIFLVQRNDAELNAKVTGLTLSLHLKQETYQKGIKEGIVFDLPLDSKPETGAVRIVVVDKNSGRMGSVTIPSEELASRLQTKIQNPQKEQNQH